MIPLRFVVHWMYLTKHFLLLSLFLWMSYTYNNNDSDSNSGINYVMAFVPSSSCCLGGTNIVKTRNIVSNFANPTTSTTFKSSTSSVVSLQMTNDDDLKRWAKSARTADIGDRIVELKRPLGLVLQEDDNGNVYVETVAPRGNAGRTGMVKEGDVLTMCSATFGDQMWSTRGVGLTRVLAAIRVRAGPTVKLVFENPSERNKKASDITKKQQDQLEQARRVAQAKKDALLKELEQDEKKLKKKKFLGLF